MNYSVTITPYIQLEEPVDSQTINTTKSCDRINCQEYQVLVNSETSYCPFCGSPLKITEHKKEMSSFPDAYDFCEEYFPDDLSEYFCCIGDGEFEDKWIFNHGIENVNEHLEFDMNDEQKSFLDLKDINIEHIIKTIKKDPKAKIALKILDEKLGEENYSISVGIFSEYS